MEIYKFKVCFDLNKRKIMSGEVSFMRYKQFTIFCRGFIDYAVV